MNSKKNGPVTVATRLALIMAWVVAVGSACESQKETVIIDDDDIGGIVVGPNGPEAGVWVIAETVDLPTRFVRIVVTDDKGRYVVPEFDAPSQ